MNEPEPLDLRRLRTYSLEERPSLVSRDRFALAEAPPPGAVAALLRTLPDFLGARALVELARSLRRARREGAPVLWGLGGHVLKVGLTPLLQDLMERGHVQGIALNGAGAIHDLELAMVGCTSEDVAESLQDGSFGMARETAETLNEAVRAGAQRGQGFGEALGAALQDGSFPHKDLSLIAAAYRRGIPVTVHVTLGADIVHMHASADGAAIGAASLRDFHRFVQVVRGLEGGAYLNVGSAVTLPEVFLKAVSIARNLDGGPRRFTTANLDQLAHYRPRVNVLQRPQGGSACDLRGHHEILVPLLRWLVLDEATESEPR